MHSDDAINDELLLYVPGGHPHRPEYEVPKLPATAVHGCSAVTIAKRFDATLAPACPGHQYPGSHCKDNHSERDGELRWVAHAHCTPRLAMHTVRGAHRLLLGSPSGR